MKEAARGRMLGTDGARVKDANGSNETGGGGSSSKLHLSLGGVQRGLGRCRRLSPLLYFDDARQRVARALVELLLAVSMVTGSPGACLVQRGGVEQCLWTFPRL